MNFGWLSSFAENSCDAPLIEGISSRPVQWFRKVHPKLLKGTTMATGTNILRKSLLGAGAVLLSATVLSVGGASADLPPGFVNCDQAWQQDVFMTGHEAAGGKNECFNRAGYYTFGGMWADAVWTGQWHVKLHDTNGDTVVLDPGIRYSWAAGHQPSVGDVEVY